ncbi:MAG TPA: cell division protein SepF [Lachnospiraceae bacterium]|nr:cell division protein SepF [Lachnospiraceae bacterium]
MSVMDKILNAMKFNDDEDYDEDDELEDEDFYGDEEDQPSDRNSKKQERASRSAVTAADDDDFSKETVAAPKPRKRFAAPSADSRNSSRNDLRTDFRTDTRTDSDTDSVSGRVKKQYSEAGMEVCIIKPTSVNDARDVTDTLLSNSTVVLNLEGLDVEIAQRIIDFTSGSCYAVHGNVMKISHYIFVITPANVDVSGDISTAISGTRNSDSGSLNMPYGGRN